MARENKQDIINIRVSKDYKDKLKQKAEYSHRSEPPNRMVRATQSRAESHLFKV